MLALRAQTADELQSEYSPMFDVYEWPTFNGIYGVFDVF